MPKLTLPVAALTLLASTSLAVAGSLGGAPTMPQQCSSCHGAEALPVAPTVAHQSLAMDLLGDTRSADALKAQMLALLDTLPKA